MLAAIFMFAVLLGAADVVNAPLMKWSKVECCKLSWWILQNNLVSFWMTALIYIACLHAYISTHFWFKPGSERRMQYHTHHVRRIHFLKNINACLSMSRFTEWKRNSFTGLVSHAWMRMSFIHRVKWCIVKSTKEMQILGTDVLGFSLLLSLGMIPFWRTHGGETGP